MFFCCRRPWLEENGWQVKDEIPAGGARDRMWRGPTLQEGQKLEWGVGHGTGLRPGMTLASLCWAEVRLDGQSVVCCSGWGRLPTLCILCRRIGKQSIMSAVCVCVYVCVCLYVCVCVYVYVYVCVCVARRTVRTVDICEWCKRTLEAEHVVVPL